MLGLMSILTFSLILGVLIPNLNENKNRKRIYLFVIFCIMFLYSALRGANVGIDTYNYNMRFYEIQSYGLWDSFVYLRLEKGYILLNYILSSIFNNPQAVIVVTSLFITYAFAKCIYEYSENVVLSTFLYIMFFFSSTMNITRQYIALGFIMLAFRHIIDKRVIKTALLFTVAILFHNTAIVSLPFLVLTMPKFKINIKTILLSCFVSIVILYGFDGVLNLFIKIFPVYGRFMSSSIYSAESDLSLFWLLYYIAILIGAIIAMRRGFKNNKDNLKASQFNRDSFGLFVLLYVAFIVCYIFSKRLWIASRMLAYFKPALCIVLPNVLEKLLPKKSIVKYSIYFVFVGAFFVWAYSIFAIDAHGLFPYRFFWSE